MRRGQHTSRVLKALGTPNGGSTGAELPKLASAEIIPNQFADLHEEEEE
jgi:acetolactate synthase-1/3 small subunit